MTNAEIEAFLTICEYGSISKAAEKLFISQSSLSTKIKTLENKMGCALFVRGKGLRGIHLTEEGRRFLELAIKYQKIIDEMMEIGKTNKTPKLRVSSINSMGTYLLTPAYENFLQKMPDVVLEIQDMATDSVYISMENGFTDLGFTVSRRENRKTVTYPAFSEPMVFICPYNADYPDVIELNMLDIKNEVYIYWFDEFDKWHKDAFGPNAIPQLQLEIMSQLEFFVTKNKNWAIAPKSVACGLARDNKVKICSLAFDVPNRVTYCVYVPDKSKAAIIKCFLGCFKDTLLSFKDMDIDIYI